MGEIAMKYISFEKPWSARLVNKDKYREGDILQNLYSVISAGTELAILSGKESWAPLPFVPGYGAIGKMVNIAPESPYEKDKVYFTYGKHQEFIRPETICLPMDGQINPMHAVFARMAAVSITSIRCSNISLGDSVAVVGGGLVGNFAAQLARLSGATVSLIDPFASRRHIAQQCNITNTFKDSNEAIEAKGIDLFDTVIDATGVPSVVMDSSRLVGKHGELIILGSPRGSYTTDITPFLNRSHLSPTNMTVKGAHEWRYPLHADTQKTYKFSIEGNLNYLFYAIMKKELLIEPVITHVIKPSEAPGIYIDLKNNPDAYLGIVIDWSKK
jgi:2-desacetyl-2-hydroxyethyl bacteriochlorophyllide A dehydrogenase